ncbi:MULTISPECIES: peptide chain release factor H [Mameliella]|uniref:peptide chain release factor H n=1 Tax=Mameliella TaxID=1434019 RepID=UPI000B52B614|nr:MULTISPECIES: peptide chain release factor H [Mameliella]MCR9271680.1 peptide chain release factor H [Paracoccaceae bacterium]OWV60877.1 peptide chain release factor H [Mameliella alba]
MVTLLISSGNGPCECQQAVGHVLTRLAEEAEAQGVTLDLAERAGRTGPVSAIAVLSGPGAQALAARWEGVLLWRCPSTLRPRHKRKNWFVQVFRLPRTARGAHIDPREVEMTAIRAGGPGGQHQNKTSSAIRARWGAYAVVVRDQRSQHQNRRLALERLQALADADAAEARAAREGQAHWLHHQLQRGDPARTFEGPQFRER